MNVIDYITITSNLKNGWLQITSDYMKKCNRLQLITITRVPEMCRFCRVGQQKYVKSDKNWFFVGPQDQ
jgi:hypothetical protein